MIAHLSRYRRRFALAALIAAVSTSSCGGPNTPSGSVVNSPGGSGPPPTRQVNVTVTITIAEGGSGLKPAYLSPNTESLVVQLASVNGNGVTGVNPTVINTVPRAHDCKVQGRQLRCSATATGSPGYDIFTVTTYDGTNATGALLSVGTVQAKIGSGARLGFTNDLPLTLDGVVASLKLSLSPNQAKRGTRMAASVSLDAYDASGAQIVGPSKYSQPLTLAIEGDAQHAFALHDSDGSGESFSVIKPTEVITLAYDGNDQASPVSVQANVSGPSSISARAGFSLRGKQGPPPVGTIYVLNLGSNQGVSATVTEYDGTAKGNAAPERTLALSPKLYARSIAVDSSGNLYVGYLDNDLGFSPATGEPDTGNEIAIYAPGASGNDQPEAMLTQDSGTSTTIFPVFIAFDPSGRLVTYGATSVDGNLGDAMLTYAAGSSGAAAPEFGWQFATPKIRYAGPTGLALDSSGNFYVNGALYTPLGSQDGLFVASAGDIGNPAATPARTIPWDSKTELIPGLTASVAINPSGEIFIGNAVTQGHGSPSACQARVNVYASGAEGGTTDNPPLRILTLDGVFAAKCSLNNPLLEYFPALAMYQTTLFAADDLNNAVDAFASDGQGTVKASLHIAGSATQLNAPIAVVVTSVSGQAKAGPVTGVRTPEPLSH